MFKGPGPSRGSPIAPNPSLFRSTYALSHPKPSKGDFKDDVFCRLVVVFLFLGVRWLLASVAFVASGFGGFWLLWLIFCGFWLLWLLASVAFGFCGFWLLCGFWVRVV